MWYVVEAVWKDRKTEEGRKRVERVVFRTLPADKLVSTGMNVTTGMRDSRWEYATERGAKAAAAKLRKVANDTGVSGIRVSYRERYFYPYSA